VTAGFSKSDQSFHTFDIFSRENFRTERVLAPAAFGKRFAFAVFSREQPICQWEVRKKSNPGARAFRQDLCVCSALQETVRSVYNVFIFLSKSWRGIKSIT